jgi:hypothetical protein
MRSVLQSAFCILHFAFCIILPAAQPDNKATHTRRAQLTPHPHGDAFGVGDAAF